MNYIPLEFHGVFTKKPTLESWLAKRFVSIPKEASNKFQKLAGEIESNMPFLKKVNQHNTKKKVGDINVANKMVPVFVGKCHRSQYDHNKERIVVSYYDDINRIMSDFLRELSHAYGSEANG